MTMNLIKEIKNIPAAYKADEFSSTQTTFLTIVFIVAIATALYFGVPHNLLNN